MPLWLPGIAEPISPLVGEAWHLYPYLEHVIGAIERELAKPNGRIIVNTPPRHGKSTTTSHWLPVAFLEAFPQRKVILASHTAKAASEWGQKARDTFAIPELCTEVRQDKSAIDDWQTTEGGGMRTTGVGGPITGKGFHLGIIDDVTKNAEQAYSPVFQQKTIDWFNSTFYTRAEPGGCIVVNMTRWHENDLTGWLLREHSDDWTHIVLPALAEDDDQIGRAPGEALCPERYDAEDLQRIRTAVGSWVWAGLYQQRPRPASGAIIKRHWLRYYDQLPDGARLVGLSVDATFKDTDGSDYVVIQAWARRLAEFYLVDQIRERMDFQETCVALLNMIERWPGALSRWIEDKANGPAIISALESMVPGLIAVEPMGSKEARVRAVSPLFEAGNVFLPRHAPWLGAYEAELCAFPSAPHDDQADATSQALLKMTESSKPLQPGDVKTVAARRFESRGTGRNWGGY
ncbi:MAG: phage terminase large subunit [Myxococcales bacterium]|nr:phage terminase large subunit [Myxococcales bacterium]